MCYDSWNRISHSFHKLNHMTAGQVVELLPTRFNNAVSSSVSSRNSSRNFVKMASSSAPIFEFSFTAAA